MSRRNNQEDRPGSSRIIIALTYLFHFGPPDTPFTKGYFSRYEGRKRIACTPMAYILSFRNKILICFKTNFADIKINDTFVFVKKSPFIIAVLQVLLPGIAFIAASCIKLFAGKDTLAARNWETKIYENNDTF